MIQDADARELDAHIDHSPEVVVLFSGKDDPYSRDFFPVFREATLPAGVDAVRAIVAEDDDAPWERWRIEVTPTVAYFRGGEEVERVEGLENRGLDPHLYRRFVNGIATIHHHASTGAR